jgi:toxin ParE1/3/4
VSYRLSGRAEADLAEIWDYSAGQWSVDQADRYVDALVSRFAWLSENGALWKPRPDLAEGLFSYPQQSHVIYFRTCADVPDLIEIVRVLHGRMEPDKHSI